MVIEFLSYATEPNKKEEKITCRNRIFLLTSSQFKLKKRIFVCLLVVTKKKSQGWVARKNKKCLRAQGSSIYKTYM